MIRVPLSARTTLACWMLLLLMEARLGHTAQRTPVSTTKHFAIYSDFETKLNDALIAAGRLGGVGWRRRLLRADHIAR